jgi:hypothetical protein
MNTNQKSVSDLTIELECATIALLSAKFGHHEKGLGFSVVILADAMIRGQIGSRVPRSMRNRAFVSWQARNFASKHNRNPTFVELLALVA